METIHEFPYIGKDLLGFRYNTEYPPNRDRYGITYGGYATNARNVLFYDFAVQGYDVEFKYKDKTYHLLYDSDHAALTDENYTKEFQVFKDPMDLIKNLEIDGHKLIDIIDDLEDVEAV